MTNLSLPIDDYILSLPCKEIKIYGFGSDGMVSASKEMLDLIKSIGDSRSKQEEDKIISKESEILKKKIVESGIASATDVVHIIIEFN